MFFEGQLVTRIQYQGTSPLDGDVELIDLQYGYQFRYSHLECLEGMMQRFSLTALGMVNALGTNLRDISAGVFNADTTRLSLHILRTTGATVPVGRVRGPLPDIAAGSSKLSMPKPSVGICRFSTNCR